MKKSSSYDRLFKALFIIWLFSIPFLLNRFLPPDMFIYVIILTDRYNQDLGSLDKVSWWLLCFLGIGFLMKITIKHLKRD